MSKGFAHPYVLIVALVLIGAGVAVFTGSQNLSGLVLGAKNRKENIYQDNTNGFKVTVISKNTSWDLLQYLCKTREECETSVTSGKWWATISGAATTKDGHEVFIERSDNWADYRFLKIAVREAGLGKSYLVPDSSGQYYLYDLSADVASSNPSSIVFQ